MDLVKVVVPEDTDHCFRKTAMERFGYTKGSLSKAAEEAFNQWAENMEEFSKEIQELGDPVDAIRGMLKHVKKSSVEIQHEI